MKRAFLLIIMILILILLVFIINLRHFRKEASVISKGEPITSTDTNSVALLIIDLQEGTSGNESKIQGYKDQSDHLIQTVNRIIDSSDKYGIPVIYIKNEVYNMFVNLLNKSFAIGSPGAKFDSRLKIVSNNFVSKEKLDAFSNPKLDSILISNRVNKLYFTGLDVAYCVYNTIQAAKNRGYVVSLIDDALISGNDSIKRSIIAEFPNDSVEIIHSTDFFEMFKN